MIAEAMRVAAEKIRTDANVKYARGHIPFREATFLLAVADWLEQEIRACSSSVLGTTDDDMLIPEAVAVARAYLGEQS